MEQKTETKLKPEEMPEYQGKLSQYLIQGWRKDRIAKLENQITSAKSSLNAAVSPAAVESTANTNVDANTAQNGIDTIKNGVAQSVDEKYNNIRGDINGAENGNQAQAGGNAGVSGETVTEPDQGLAGETALHGRTDYRGIGEHLKQQLTNNGSTPIELRTEHDPSSFYAKIGEAKESNPYGAFVTQHEIEDYAKMRTFLNDDGTVGVAVKDDGDIVSVFKNKKNKSKDAVSSILLTALENGGTKLDNYDGVLSKMYLNHGFIPVARTAFVDEYAPSDWNYERDGRPDIIFWMHNGNDVETVARNIGTQEMPDLKALPLMEYDEAAAYRDGLITKNASANPTFKDLGANTPTPAVQNAPQSINDLTPDTPIDQADAIIEHAIAPAFRDNLTAMNRAKRWIYKNFVSGQESLERFSKKQASIDKGTTTVDAAVQQLRNIGGTVDYIMDTELVDRDRNPTGLGSYKQIMTPPDGIDFDVVQEYLLNKHNVDRMSLKQRGYDKNKAVMANENGRARTAKQSREIVQQMEQQYPGLKAWDNRRKNWWNTFVREHMVATGLISDESWQEWCKQYPNYVPTFRKIFDERGSANSTKGSTDIGGRVRSAKGSKLEVVDVRESFADYINSMVRASAKNDVILNMFNFAESHPDAVAEYCQIIDDQTGNINPTDPNLNPFDALATEAYNEAKDGQYILRCKIDGYWRAMSVSKDVYDGVSDLFSRDYSDTERVLMDIGTKLNWGQKALITGYNPFFAIRNTLRDTQTAYLNDEGTNPLSFLKSIYDAAKDIITDSPDFEKFKAYGGDRSGFFKSNEGFIKSAGLDTEKGSKAARTAKKAVMFIPNAFAKMGEASETLNRYASAKRYLNRHGGSIDGDWQSAMLASAEGTTNFSRSGKVAKLADCYALYLNANIQGTDKMLRQYTGADTAAKTWGKTAGMAIASVLLKYLFNNDDNEHYRNLSNYIKDNNYCIPNILGERDENGYCTSFIVLPKPQGYGAIIAGFERIATMWDEDKSLEEAYDGYMDSLSGALPVNSSLPWSAFKQAINNENWYGGTIEPQRMEDLPVEERYDNGTSTIAINLAKGDAALMDTEFGKWLADSKLGKKLGIGQWSPMKIDYLLEQKTGVGGDLVLPPLAVENFENYGTDEQRFNPNSAVKGLLDPIKTQFVKDPLYSNDIMGKFYDAKEDAKAAADEAKKLRNSAGIDEESDEEKYYYHYSDMSAWISYSNAIERDIRNSEPNTKERDEKIRTLRKERIDNLKEFMANPEGYKPPKVPKNFWKNRNGR